MAEFNIEIHYNTLTNEFGDRIMCEGFSTVARVKASGEFDYFQTEKSAKIWLNKKSGKAKKWIKTKE